ncbi:unnamed protein product [Microthlaspi erraticum]|uniref:Uncharacterized protein n=1 Tax=Microthlaspi erraticum TaxID=1685480 RepID=A0A6D2IB50_9BRAS|nr:unnamed protein product [Microthlaspi erraticum]
MRACNWEGCSVFVFAKSGGCSRGMRYSGDRCWRNSGCTRLRRNVVAWCSSGVSRDKVGCALSRDKRNGSSKYRYNPRFQPFFFSDSLVNGTEVEVSDMEL